MSIFSKSSINDLLNGITPQKRKEIDAELRLQTILKEQKVKEEHQQKLQEVQETLATSPIAIEIIRLMVESFTVSKYRPLGCISAHDTRIKDCGNPVYVCVSSIGILVSERYRVSFRSSSDHGVLQDYRFEQHGYQPLYDPLRLEAFTILLRNELILHMPHPYEFSEINWDCTCENDKHYWFKITGKSSKKGSNLTSW